MEKLHEQLLQACFGRTEESRLALEACAGMQFDAATTRILPFVYHRWKGFANNELVEAGHRAYLTTWRQNRERMPLIREFLMGLRKEGADSMLLKGAALTLRHYRDYGLRNMGDFDVLVPAWDMERTVRYMLRTGWKAEGECTAESIIRQSRARHAWQFSRGELEHCDLHWRPLARCGSPAVTDMFWQGAETADLDGLPVKVPCATDQLFHACVHAMHWEWTPNLYWFADVLLLLGQGKIDWARAGEMARTSRMTVGFQEALTALRTRFPVEIGHIEETGDEWQSREFASMQKACPLGWRDRLAWHLYHFERLRPDDRGWREASIWAAFPDYLRTFVDSPSLLGLVRRLSAELLATDVHR
jgi:hypothetical protein